ncbi:MAG: hypothetical protein WC659_04560 [Patescibacteria group bacterium]
MSAALALMGVFLLVPGAHAQLGWLVNIAEGTLITMVTTLIYGIVWFFGMLVTVTLIPILVMVASYNDFATEYGVQLGWTVVRDVSNMFFIVVLLVIAVATIFKVESYSYRALLPKLLIMAVLINFSRMITGFFIDLAQIIMLTFVNSFRDIAGGNIIDAVGIGDILSYSAKTTASLGNVESMKVLGGLLLGLAVAAVTAGVLLAFILVLVFRVIMLWTLTVLSPLAYLLSAFPGGQKYSSQWWEKFTSHLIVGPVLAFFLWLTFAIMQQGSFVRRENTTFGKFLAGEKTTIDQYNPFETKVGRTDSLINFIIVISLLVGSLTLTQQLGVMGGQFAGTVSGKLQQWGAAPFKGIAKGVGGLGKAAGAGIGKDAASRLGISEELLSKEGLKKLWTENVTEKGKRWRRQRVDRIQKKREEAGSMKQFLSAPAYNLRHRWDTRTLKELVTKGPGVVFGKKYQKMREEAEAVGKRKEEIEAEIAQGNIGEAMIGKIQVDHDAYSQMEQSFRGELESLDIDEAKKALNREKRIYTSIDPAKGIGTVEEYLEDNEGKDDPDKLREEFKRRQEFSALKPEQMKEAMADVIRFEHSVDAMVKEKEDEEKFDEEDRSARWKEKQTRIIELKGLLSEKDPNSILNKKKEIKETIDDLEKIKKESPADFEQRAMAYFAQKEINEQERADLFTKGGLTKQQVKEREARLIELNAPGGVIKRAEGDLKFVEDKITKEGETPALKIQKEKQEKMIQELKKEAKALEDFKKLHKDLEELPNKLARAIAGGDARGAAETRGQLLDRLSQFDELQGKKYDGGKKLLLASVEEEKFNQGFIEAAKKQAQMYKKLQDTPRITEADREEKRREVEMLDVEIDKIKKDADQIRPSFDYETRQHTRHDIDEEERKLTTDNWKELVRIAEDAIKEKDGVRAAAALRKATRYGNENELQNWFNYGSNAGGLKEFVMGELVGNKGGLTKEMAEKMDLSWDDYIDQYGIKRQGFKNKPGLGLTSDIGLAVGNDVSYTGEGIGHWGVARAVDIDYFTGEPMWAKEIERNIECLAEIEKVDFESFMRNRNRLALFNEVPFSSEDFRKTGNREGHIMPMGVTLYARNYFKMPRLLSQGRMQPSMQKNLGSPEALNILSRLSQEMPADRAAMRDVNRQLLSSMRAIPPGFGDVRRNNFLLERFFRGY